MPKRVLLAGLFHETQMFLPGLMGQADFLVRRDGELLTARGDGSPLSGALEVGHERGWMVLPTVDYRATPGPTVDSGVFERFWSEFAERARGEIARGIDGVYLVLHGAMACDKIEDVEGEFLERMKGLLGATDVPVVGVADLHGNFSERMAAGAHALVAYRENPHADAHESARRAAELLDRLMKSGERPRTVLEQPPLMLPPTGTGTVDEPMKTLERMARDLEREFPDELLSVNVFGGFSFADIPDTGVSFTAVTLGDTAVAKDRLRALSRAALAAREVGNRLDMPLAEAMARLREHTDGPVVIVEPADNIGGGAPGDCTSVLRAFVEHKIPRAAVAIHDPAAVAKIREHKPGDTIELEIGGRASALDPGPVRARVEIVSTSDGAFDLEDPQSHLASMCGTRYEMGPCAVVRLANVTVLLTSNRTPPFDLGQWRSQGIDPARLFAIGVKAAVAHRRAYDRVAKASYTVDSPGPCSSNLRLFPFRRVRRPIYPLDPISVE